MALTPIPPWLDISPAFFTNAASSGARIGLEQAGQAINANEAGDRLRLGYAQLAAENSRAGMEVSAAERREGAANALRRMEMQMHLDQNNALNQYRAGRLGDFQEGLDLRKAAQDATAAKSALIENDASSFLKELTSGSEAADALKKYPLAGHDPTIRSLITQGEISKRTENNQSAITDRSKSRLEQKNNQFRITDLMRHIGRIETALNNPNLELDEITKKQMVDELSGLKSEKSQLEKGLTMPATPAEASSPAPATATPAVNADPLGILTPATAAPNE